MKASFLLFAAAGVSLLTVPRAAYAAPPSEPSLPDPTLSSPSASPTPVGRRWYGWETLTTDGASVALVSMAVATDNGGAQAPFAYGGLAGFSLGAPIVHAAHGRWGLAAGDLGMRVGSVLLGGLIGAGIGAAAAPACSGFACIGNLTYDTDGMLVGASIGAVTASVIDASVLSYEKAPPGDSSTSAFSSSQARGSASFTWSPTVRMLKDGACVGLTGTF